MWPEYEIKASASLSQKHGRFPSLIRFDYHQITYGYKPMRLGNILDYGTLFSP